VDPGVVDHRVNAAERLDRGADDGCGLVFVSDVGTAPDGFTAGLVYLADDVTSRGRRRARSVDSDAIVGDDDGGTLGGQMEGVASPHAATGAGDDNDAAVET
jgi:hypothetical protein